MLTNARKSNILTKVAELPLPSMGDMRNPMLSLKNAWKGATGGGLPAQPAATGTWGTTPVQTPKPTPIANPMGTMPTASERAALPAGTMGLLGSRSM